MEKLTSKLPKNLQTEDLGRYAGQLLHDHERYRPVAEIMFRRSPVGILTSKLPKNLQTVGWYGLITSDTALFRVSACHRIRRRRCSTIT